MLRVTLVAVGRLKAGPERDLVDRYLGRAVAAGRALGLAVSWRELEESRAKRGEDRRRDEANALRAVVAPGHLTIVLDETGGAMDSAAFADLIAHARDTGRGAFNLVIGGPDGFDPSFRAGADHAIAFGRMTWPHQLVRIMAAEQIYRAATILSGHPYHRA